MSVLLRIKTGATADADWSNPVTVLPDNLDTISKEIFLPTGRCRVRVVMRTATNTEIEGTFRADLCAFYLPTAEELALGLTRPTVDLLGKVGETAVVSSRIPFYISNLKRTERFGVRLYDITATDLDKIYLYLEEVAP